MQRITYAQNFEDVRLWRAFRDVEQGRYLDIGTQDPNHDSVSRFFYDMGWRGVHVEPTPHYAAAMREARPDEKVVEAAVSCSSVPLVLYEIHNTGLSTGLPEIARFHEEAGWSPREILVPTISLANLLDFMGSDPIHWMKIDVEGMEADVLASWGDHPARPAALVIEATKPNTQEPTHEAWHALVTSRGYHEVLFDGLSRYFIHESEAHRGEALALSPNIFDGFQVLRTHYSNQLVSAEIDSAMSDLAKLQEEARMHEAALAKAEELASAASEQLAATQADHLALTRLTGRLEGQLEAQEQWHAASLAAAAAQRDELRDRLQAADQELAEVRERAADLRTQLAVQIARSEADGGALNALRNEAEVLRAALAVREIRMAEAERLLAHMPDPLTGTTGLRRALARRLIGSSNLSTFARHQTAAREWQHSKPQPVFVGPGASDIPPGGGPGEPHANQTTVGARMLPVEGPIRSVPQLLAPHDRAFVHAAYWSVLGRAPEPEGEAYYLARLRAGAHKLAILKQLRRSPEGRTFVPGVAGLDRAIKRHWWATRPLVGPIVRLFTGTDGNSRTQRQHRILMNEIGRVQLSQLEESADRGALSAEIAALHSQLSELPGMLQHLASAAQSATNATSVQPPSLDPGAMPVVLDSAERRLLGSLRLFALTRGAPA